MRVGMGYDVHRLAAGRKLIIGGVEIPYEKGLLGHSDADVLLHAIMDALLGAAALGDIGKHFPDTDPEYEGISSIKLLEHVGRLLDEGGYVIENIDATIIAQRPKMRPHIDQMRENIAAALNIETEQVNVKATTEEGLGFTGTGTGQPFLSDYFVRNASYLKCQNITLGYSFPALLKYNNQDYFSGRVFFTVQNPFIITKYKGLDPEISSGIDNNPYPRPMSFQLGLNLNF